MLNIKRLMITAWIILILGFVSIGATYLFAPKIDIENTSGSFINIFLNFLGLILIFNASILFLINSCIKKDEKKKSSGEMYTSL